VKSPKGNRANALWKAVLAVVIILALPGPMRAGADEPAT